MYNKFEALNRATRDFNNGNVSRSHVSASNRNTIPLQYRTFDYLNGKTYERNNGKRSNFYR